MQCLEALAQHGAQPGIESHPGFFALMSCIEAMEPDGLLAAAGHLARLSSPIPTNVAEDIALAASISYTVLNKLDTRSVKALVCLDRCAGPNTAAYQSLRQHVVSNATTSLDLTRLLSTLSRQQYSRDRDLLSLAGSRMFELLLANPMEQTHPGFGWVSWCGHH